MRFSRHAPRFVVTVAAAGSVALAATGCGGAERKLPPPVTVAASTHTATTTTAPSSTVAGRPGRHQARSARASKARKPASAAPPTRTTTTTTDEVSPEIVKPRTRKAAAKPITCLKGEGLARARTRPGGGWQAAVSGSSRQVFVDGPFRTDEEAQVSASSLESINDARAAAGYVVSAPLSSRARAVVSAVAACLRRS